MRPIVLVLVFLALGIAGLTALLASRLVGTPQAPATISQPVGPPAEDVLVAAVDIRPGAVIKPEDLRYEAWPTANMDPRLIRKSAGDDARAAFIGAVARRPVQAGEPLSAQAVFRQDKAGVLAGLLLPGMRAVSLAVTQTSGVGGFVLPNDRVDIILNEDLKAAESAGQELHGDFLRLATQVVLSDVRVLAIDDKLAKPDSPNLAAHVVTVEVAPKDVEVLLTAVKMGEVSLALRSLTTPEPPEAKNSGYTSDLDVSRALQAAVGHRHAAGGGGGEVVINRGGTTSSQSFAK